MTLRIHVVGGLGAFGQNCMVVQDLQSGDAVVVDAGAGFPKEGSGHELLVANPAFIRDLQGQLRGYLLTHGHEDHVGAVGLLCREARAPVYGSPTTLSVVREKCDDIGLPMPELHPFVPGQEIRLGVFTITALAVSHSIPDALCLLIEAGGLSILHSGDFRVDNNPVCGPPTDMSGLSWLGDRGGVDLLMADSTGAISDGHNPGERSVRPQLEEVFRTSPRRIFLTTFASHIQRLTVVAELSAQYGRKLLLAGRGTLMHTRIASGLGNAPWLEGLAMHASEALDVAPERITVLLSGCQAEEGSAFWRQAHGDGRLPPVEWHDTVVHSARAVPGNEGKLQHLLDLFARKGARIVDAKDRIHVSGHGYREDMRELIRAVKPRTMMPVHGGFRHLHALADLAVEEGIDEALAPVLQSGDVVEIEHGGPLRKVAHRPVESMLLDEQGQLSSAQPLLDERRELNCGVVVLSALVDGTSGELRGRPTLTTRGLGGFAVELLRHEGAHEAHVSFNALTLEQRMDSETVRNALSRGVRRVLRRVPGRPPAIMTHVHIST